MSYLHRARLHRALGDGGHARLRGSRVHVASHVGGAEREEEEEEEEEEGRMHVECHSQSIFRAFSHVQSRL
jgi:hypothetical protein